MAIFIIMQLDSQCKRAISIFAPFYGSQVLVGVWVPGVVWQRKLSLNFVEHFSLLRH